MPKRLQYDALATGISNAQAQERITPDKWLGSCEPPISNWKKAVVYSVAAIAPFFFFGSTVGNATFPERPQLDKWQPINNQPVQTVKHQEYTYPSYFSGIKQPAMETLQDDMEFGGMDSGKWTKWGTVGANATTNLLLELTSVLGGDYGGWLSRTTYDLTSSYAFDQLVDAGNQSLTSLEVYPIELTTGNNAISIMVSGNFVFARKKIAGSYTTVGSSVAYNSSTMKWFRIRESAGTTYWEYATDPTGTWTLIASAANPITVSTLTGGITIGTWQAEASTTTAKVDNFNVLPSQFQFFWKGFTWNKRIHAGDPANNQLWTPNNIVGPDGNNYLTLALTNPSNMSPLGAEIFSAKRGFGYGVYTVVIGTELDTMDHKVGFGGLFTFDFTAPPDYKEIDAHETRDYASAPNIQLLHSHVWNNGGTRNFIVDNQDVNAAAVQTHRLIWEPGKLTFDAFIGAGVDGTNYFHTVHNTNVPTPGLERVHFNIWNNTAVANYQSATPINVVIQDFDFTPLGEASYLTEAVPSKVFDVLRNQYTYPSFFFSPFPIPGGEAITVDKWFAPTQQPRFDTQRNQHLYQSIALDTKALTQPERITPDKWLPQRPDVVFDIKRQQHTYPSLFLELTNSQRPEKVSIDRWLGQRPDILFDIKRLQYSYPSSFFYPFPQPDTSELELDKYDYQDSPPRWDIARNQYTYPSFFMDTNALTQKERVSLDKWNPQKPDIVFDIKRQHYIFPSFFFYPVPLTGSEIVTVDKWFVSTQQPRFDIARNQYLYQTGTIDTKQLTQPERTSPDKWTGQHPDVLFDSKRTQYTYPSFFVDAKQLTLPERVSLDKWFIELQRPVFSLTKTNYLIQSSFQPANQPLAFLDKWLGNYPSFIVGKMETRYQYPSVFLSLFPTPVIVALNKWFAEIQQPLNVPKSQQYMYPTGSIDTKILTQHERITSDKWLGTYPDFIYDIPRKQYLHESFMMKVNTIIYGQWKKQKKTAQSIWLKVVKPG